jgi:hypothetical protein
MKKYTFKFLTILLLIGGIVVSCSKDKGNYDYTTLDPTTIDVTGLATTYSVVRFTDYLDINPVITYKGQVVNTTNPQFPELSFSWDMYPSIANVANKTTAERYALGNSLKLHRQMTEPEGSWEVLLTTTNTNTGVKTFAKFIVNITPSLAEGWMVLYERNGTSDVGIIVNNEIARAAATEKLMLDVYAVSNGAPLQGTPTAILHSKSNNAAFSPALLNTLYVQTNKDMVNVGLTTFQKVGGLAYGIFFSAPAVVSLSYVASTEARKDFIINNNKVYRADYTIIGAGDKFFGDALSGTYGTLAPWMPSSVSASFDAIVYDQTNKKFLKIANRGSDLVPIPIPQNLAVAGFDINNVGLTFVMADAGWNNWEYMVMKDDANKYFLLSANFKETEKIGTPAVDNGAFGKAKYDMSACPEVTSINSVTAGTLGEIFYYSANNHLYQYKYKLGTTDQLWTANAGETITKIMLQKYNTNTNRALGPVFDPKNYCKILYVATYNESTKVGSVYQMEVNPSNGAIIAGTQKSYTGFGKIKDMGWKIR